MKLTLKENTRHIIQVYLVKIFTKTSGDYISSTGEWYFKVGGQTTPKKGHIKLSAGSNFELKTPMQLFTGFYTNKKTVKIKFQVKEKDILFNDNMLKDVLVINTKTPPNGKIVLKSKNDKVHVTLFVTVEQTEF